MPSVHEIKCPSCGAENGPCLVQNGQDMYRIERKKAADPTTYEHPECEECRQLQDRMVNAEYSVSSFAPSFGGGRPKSNGGQSYKDGFRRLELARNDARAKYEFHLGTVHQDQSHQGDLVRNLEIMLREGRLNP